jgi:hypothetical protein
VPSEITKALEGLGSAVHEASGIPKHTGGPRTRVDMGSMERVEVGGSDAMLSKAHDDVQKAIADAQASAGTTPAAAASGTPETSGSADAPDASAPPAEEPPTQ